MQDTIVVTTFLKKMAVLYLENNWARLRPNNTVQISNKEDCMRKKKKAIRLCFPTIVILYLGTISMKKR